jgi:ribosomal-protein-alanine N-acetyltransferase
MLVESITPADREMLAKLVERLAPDVDVDAELVRSWARIWMARPQRGASAVAFLLAWAVADELHIINVATEPAFRRQGAAGTLLDAAVHYARTDRARLVLLEVRRSNHEAINLYRSRGFSAIGLRRRYYADNGEDAVEMLLALDPETGQIVPGHDEIELRTSTRAQATGH